MTQRRAKLPAVDRDLPHVVLSAVEVKAKLEGPHRVEPTIGTIGTLRFFIVGDRLLKVARNGTAREYDYATWRQRQEQLGAIANAQMRGEYVDPLWDGIERSDAGMQRCARGLTVALHLEVSVIDGTLASLAAVDRALGHLPRESWADASVFAPLAAYAGEVLRQRLDDAHWEFDRSGWPSIRDRHGHSFALVKLLEDVDETRVRTPTQLFVKACLGSIGIPT